MGVLDEDGNRRRGRMWSMPLHTKGTLWRSCAKLRESFEMSFGVVSGVGSGIGVLDGGPHAPREGEISGVFLVHWFGWRFECIKCIRLVREKFMMFNSGNVVYFCFL